MGEEGMATSVWGPKLWASLFIMIQGRYPVYLEEWDEEQREIRQQFCAIFKALPVTLPCKYCRASFAQYMTETPIESYLGSRNDLMYWLYLMKDKVNRKLINQEYMMYIKRGRIEDTPSAQLRQECFKTVPSPDFSSVVDSYEQFRAVCSPDTKSCVLKHPL